METGGGLGGSELVMMVASAACMEVVAKVDPWSWRQYTRICKRWVLTAMCTLPYIHTL